MSQPIIDEVFQKLKDVFPPVEDPRRANLKLTTEELVKAISDFTGIEFNGKESLYGMMKDNGYRYVAEEENDRIVFRWLLGKS